MLNFASFIDLPLFFVGVLALAIFMYVLLDGLDLGVGIIFPFAPSEECRNKMMNSIAPFWDGNETWLVLGGMVMFAAFPLAFSIIVPSFYIPIIGMLLGLILRGIAFEFRGKSHSKLEIKIWDFSFHIGSLIATFAQGVMLGSFIQGFQCQGNFCHVWITTFSCLVGLALVAGYSLLGSAWLIMKTEGRTQDWSRKVASYSAVFVMIFMVLVSAWSPYLNEFIMQRWFSVPNIYYLAIVPCLTLAAFIALTHALITKKETQPLIFSIVIFTLCYLGIAISLYPFIMPYHLTFADASAAKESLTFLFIGVCVTLPVIFGYTIYSYRVFRGKVSHEKMY